MKEIFVFGAGASHASGGTPLGRDLVWNYFEDCSTLYEIGSNSKPALHDIEQKKREFINFGIFLKSIQDIFPDISEYDKWQQCMSNGEMHIPRIEKKYYIDEIMSLLLQRKDKKNINLIRRLTLEHIAGTSYTSQNLLYKKFVESLSGVSKSKVSIISFNFDCLLHEDFKNRIYFDYLLDFKNIDGNRLSYEKGRGIPLIKLNGSLDWAYNPSTKEITLLFPHITPYTYKFNFDAKDNNETQIEPYIFLPHQEKEERIDALWARAKEELKQARKLTIIGYSFPAYDKDAIRFFQESINSNVELEVIEVSEDALKLEYREEEIMKKYINLFPGVKRIKIYLDGFQGYTTHIFNT
jgi:hypothetical protein